MPRPRLSLAVILLAQFVIPLSISGTAIALPTIAAELGSAPAPLQWVVNGFNLAFAICAIAWGVWSDRIGYTRSFRIGIAVAAAGGAISAIAPTIGILDVGRVIAGIGSAAVLTGAAPLLSHLFQGKARAKAFVLFGTVNGLGLAAGPAVSGLLLSVWGWRGIFAAHAVVLLVALIGTVKLPVLGRGSTSLRAILDFSALRAPGFVAMTLVPVAGAIGFVTFLTYLPSAIGAVHGLEAGVTGALMLVMTVPVLIAPIVVHRLLERTRITTTGVVVTSLACLLLGGIGVLVLLRPDLPVMAGVAPMILLGLGFGLPLGFVDAEALAAVPAERAGAASGVVNLVRIGSEAVFVALYAAILAAVVTAALPGPVGELIASGGAGEPWVYRDGLVAAGGAMVVLVAATGIAFLVFSRSADKRAAVRVARGDEGLRNGEPSRNVQPNGCTN
ncbi:MFS transporter [Pseudoclavibacter chungangensis]|uniref:MFS transporter n=1 Tax=Pseudoclavibacter chungangensis TaxID=587635 RepID=A0A7J5BM26_9MICO|nr:MFS transporter [Pseudoclavibacter chungangensis]KAB1652102.1 MFS transporter [Pseudoclavibacter chungangensis]NYJ65971.1 putative MFS family arabinose efflux permease [Pseudoclavibacter chungangensis]